MATTLNKNPLDDTEEQTGQNPFGTSTGSATGPTTGSSSAGFGGQPVQTAPTTQNSTAPTSNIFNPAANTTADANSQAKTVGTGFTNLNKYLQANRGGAANVSNALVGDINKTGTQTQSDIDTAFNTFGQAVTAGQQGDSYTGPSSFSSSTQAQDVANSLYKASQAQTLAGTNQGQQQLLGNIYKGTTAGGLSLDQYLAQQTQGQNIAGAAKALDTTLTSANDQATAANATVKSAQDQATAAAKAKADAQAAADAQATKDATAQQKAEQQAMLDAQQKSFSDALAAQQAKADAATKAQSDQQAALQKQIADTLAQQKSDQEALTTKGATDQQSTLDALYKKQADTQAAQQAQNDKAQADFKTQQDAIQSQLLKAMADARNAQDQAQKDAAMQQVQQMQQQKAMVDAQIKAQQDQAAQAATQQAALQKQIQDLLTQTQQAGTGVPPGTTPGVTTTPPGTITPGTVTTPPTTVTPPATTTSPINMPTSMPAGLLNGTRGINAINDNVDQATKDLINGQLVDKDTILPKSSQVPFDMTIPAGTPKSAIPIIQANMAKYLNDMTITKADLDSLPARVKQNIQDQLGPIQSIDLTSPGKLADIKYIMGSNMDFLLRGVNADQTAASRITQGLQGVMSASIDTEKAKINRQINDANQAGLSNQQQTAATAAGTAERQAAFATEDAKNKAAADDAAAREAATTKQGQDRVAAQQAQAAKDAEARAASDAAAKAQQEATAKANQEAADRKNAQATANMEPTKAFDEYATHFPSYMASRMISRGDWTKLTPDQRTNYILWQNDPANQGVKQNWSNITNAQRQAILNPPAPTQAAFMNPRPVTAAGGGFISGPGTSRSDSIPARLSDGEYVIPADVVQKVGKHNFDKLLAYLHEYK